MKDFTLKLKGSITIGQGDVQVHNQVREALDRDYTIIIIDLDEVTYMDSSAVGELAACYTSAKNRGARIALTRVPDKIERLLKIMCFMDIFQVFDSIEDALQILRSRSQS